MASVQDVYNELFAGRVVTLTCRSLEQFHSLRTALCKKNQICYALDMTEGSIVGKYDSLTRTAIFQLAESARKKNQNKWEIVSVVFEEALNVADFQG